MFYRRLYLPGIRNCKTFKSFKEMPCDFPLPAHLDIRTEWQLSPIAKALRLADAETDDNATMGLSTYL
jgi:hypothetical protein